MKAIYLLIIGLFSTISVFGQQDCQTCEEIEQENIKLAKNIFRTETEESKVNGDSYVSKLSAMSDERFNALCERLDYNPYFEQAKKNNPDLSSYVMYAKNLTGGTNLFCAMLDYKKEIENLPQDAKERLEVINNTIELYKNLQKALNEEMLYNTGEIIDNGVNLVIKHLPKIFPKDYEIPFFPDLDNDVANLLGKDAIKIAKSDITENIIKKSPPIKNWLADNMNKGFKFFNHIAVLSPPLKAITIHPYYRIAISLPESGKIIGHILTDVNIYFRKNEYEKLIAALESERQYIIKNGTSGPVIRNRY